MICHPCRTPDHSDCPGGSWCDCQHIGAAAAPAVLTTDDRHALTLAREETQPPSLIRISSNGDQP